MTPVFTEIESPFSARVRSVQDLYQRYLHACARELLTLGYVPFASHGWFPHFLDDDDEEERRRGMEAGKEMSLRLDPAVVHVCGDFGISAGMEWGIRWYRKALSTAILVPHRLDEPLYEALIREWQKTWRTHQQPNRWTQARLEAELAEILLDC
jgi:hypothetical protein